MAYKKSVVTYLDILGFKTLMKSANASYIESVLEVLRTEAPPNFGDAGLMSLSDQHVTFFSDSCVRSTPLVLLDGENNNLGILIHEIYELARAQANLITLNGLNVLDGIFLRGAITIGNIEHRTDVIYGPALVKTYELESKKALYPRIIIDPELMRSYGIADIPTPSEKDKEQDTNRLLSLLKRFDDEEVYFVDYMRVWASLCDEYHFRFLERHKVLILKNITEHSKTPCVLEKYIWLARYHNDRILDMPPDFFTLFGTRQEAMLISGKEDTFFQELTRDVGELPTCH